MAFLVPDSVWKANLELAKQEDGVLEKCAHCARIDICAMVVDAQKEMQHGWLGSCFSLAEMLAVLYCSKEDHPRVILSKAHAAPAQYAFLRALGHIEMEELHFYKDGPKHLQAHTDMRTDGIFCNGGSLGQGLSKAIGWHRANPASPIAVFLGDGEMQEGQVYEALMNIGHSCLVDIVPIIDANGFQTSVRPQCIKMGSFNVLMVLKGFGFEVLEVDGHDCKAFAQAWDAACAHANGKPVAIVAKTLKGGGCSITCPKGEKQPWHGRVPSSAEYLAILEELVGNVKDGSLVEALGLWKARGALQDPVEKKVQDPVEKKVQATRYGFSSTLPHVLEDPKIFVLDADLVDSCGLQAVEKHPRFIECGIAEQDMISIAGGLALAGQLPIVNTYGAFYRRGFDQIYCNASEGRRIVYVAHYSGIGYFTDGKTHQSHSDSLMMLAVPNIVILEPVNEEHAAALLQWCVSDAMEGKTIYFRLHRTPEIIVHAPKMEKDLAGPLKIPGGKGRMVFVTMGPVATGVVTRIRSSQPGLAEWDVLIVGCVGYENVKAWSEALKDAAVVVTVEDNLFPGILGTWLHQTILCCAKVHSIAVEGWGGSFRTKNACQEHFGLTENKMFEKLKSWKLL